MKKRILAMLLVLMFAVLAFTACGSTETKPAEPTTEETTETKTEETAGETPTGDGEFKYVKAEEAIDAAKDGGAHIVDLREWKDYSTGRLINSQWVPIFPLEDDSLVEPMKAYATENLMDGKDIYLVCYSGNKGAQKATGVLTEAGVDPAVIYTVEGGAKTLAEINGALTTDRTDDSIEWQYVSGADALKALSDGTATVIDVRDKADFDKGFVKDTLQVSLKDITSPEAQTEMYKLATEQVDKTKPVYFLCYSGNKCAKTAISVMKDSGFDVNNLYIIEEGAKGKDISGVLVTE